MRDVHPPATIVVARLIAHEQPCRESDCGAITAARAVNFGCHRNGDAKVFIGNLKGMIYCLANFNRNYKHFIFNPKMFVHLSYMYTLRIILYKNVLKKINKFFCPDSEFGN